MLAARYRAGVSRSSSSAAYCRPRAARRRGRPLAGLPRAPRAAAAYQTVDAARLAYAVLFLPKSIGPRAAAAAAPVARADGTHPRPVAGRRAAAVDRCRVAWPGVAAGGLLVLLTCMKELPATLLLRPTGLDTLATELWTATEVAAYGAAAPYALALVALPPCRPG